MPQMPGRVLCRGGEQIVLHPVSAVTQRLMVSRDELLKWEHQGIVPPATLIDESGRRWYSEAMIELLARALDEADCGRERSWWLYIEGRSQGRV
jgi:hypothetical protein